MKTIVIMAAFLFCSILLLGADIQTASAQLDVGLQQAEQIGLSGADPRVIVARVIQVILGLLGITAISLMVYAGFLWMTAGGSDENITKAKNIMKNGVIGLVIILSAFGIVTFVLSILAPDSILPSGSSGRRGIGGLGSGGGFPFGVVQSHYPDQGQTNVARNTNIMVTFVEPIMVNTIINDNGTPSDPSDDILNSQNVLILRSEDDRATGPFVQAKAQASEDGRSFVFDPIDLLGSSDENTLYTVILEEGITTASGRAAFGNFGAYGWEFEAGTFVDLEPPHIVSIVPTLDSTHPRNVLVQITFNEAMNPITLVGAVSKGFDNVSVKTASGDSIDGRFLTSNQYQTVEFISNDLCGRNSCGEDVYCLPGSEKIRTYLRAASVSASPPTALFPVDGITDAASNSFDGNVDGTASGSPDDDYSSSFNTTNEIDLTAPIITNVTPDPFSTQVLLDSPVIVTFDKHLQFSSIDRQTIQLPELPTYSLQALVEGDHSTIIVKHQNFEEETTYTPTVTSGLRDLYQNCYRPCKGP